MNRKAHPETMVMVGPICHPMSNSAFPPTLRFVLLMPIGPYLIQGSSLPVIKMSLSAPWAALKEESPGVTRLREENLPLYSILMRPHWQCWVHLWGPQHRIDMEQVQRKGHKRWSEEWNTSLTKTGWENWSCSALIREGSIKTPRNLAIQYLNGRPTLLHQQIVLG